MRKREAMKLAIGDRVQINNHARSTCRWDATIVATEQTKPDLAYLNGDHPLFMVRSESGNICCVTYWLLNKGDRSLPRKEVTS